MLNSNVKVTSQLDPSEIDHTSMIVVEIPSNPDCIIADIRELAKIAKEKRCTLVADCTFASPYLFSSLESGADIEIHSCTKFLGGTTLACHYLNIKGHHDTLGGVAICKEMLHAFSLNSRRTHMGNVLGTLESWLLLRSTSNKQ